MKRKKSGGKTVGQRKMSESDKLARGSVKGLVLPVLPLSEVVMFPGVIRPWLVTREHCVAAVRYAIETNSEILLLTMKRTVDKPKREHMYEIGTLGKVLQWVDPQNGTIKVMLSGVARAKVLDFLEDDDSRVAECEEKEGQRRTRRSVVAECEEKEGLGFLRALVEVIPERVEKDAEVQALMNNLVSIVQEYVDATKRLPSDSEEEIGEIAEQDDPVQLVDTVARHLQLGFRTQQEILGTLDLKKRLEKLIEIIVSQIQIRGIEKEIEGRVHEQVTKQQKEFYLTERMKAIQKELGRDPQVFAEEEELRLDQFLPCGLGRRRSGAGVWSVRRSSCRAGGTDGVPLLLSSAMSTGPGRALLESSGTH